MFRSRPGPKRSPRARVSGVSVSTRDEQAVEDPEKRRQSRRADGARRDRKQTRLRGAAKQLLAAPSALSLWQASKATPQLSADAALAERKERFLDVIEGVRRDYF